MISAEAPVLFAKAAEIFITEISLRAWIHTEDNKRRTLQRNDIAMAITKYDQFDFLIDIVPRDELKPAKRQENDGLRNATTGATAVNTDQVQYYLQLAQQHQALQQQGTATQPQQIQILQSAGGALQSGQFAVGPQVVQVQVPNSGAGQAGGDGQNATTNQQVLQLAQPTTNVAGGGQIQIIQPVVSNGDVQQQIPIQLTPQQLQQVLKAQLTNQAGLSQPIILQASSLASPTISMPQYQIATSGGQQFVVSGNASANIPSGQATENASPQLEDDSNGT